MAARIIASLACATALAGCTEDWDFAFGDPPPLTCGTEECDAAGEVCCLDETGQNPGCRATCELPSITVACSRQEHCPGEACCSSPTEFDGAACRSSCMGTDFDVCPGTENTCAEGFACTPNESAEGVFICVE